jgi:hypothetical protein
MAVTVGKEFVWDAQNGIRLEDVVAVSWRGAGFEHVRIHTRVDGQITFMFPTVTDAQAFYDALCLALKEYERKL